MTLRIVSLLLCLAAPGRASESSLEEHAAGAQLTYPGFADVRETASDLPTVAGRAVGPGSRGLVVLVHGFNPAGDDFAPLESELRRRGYEVVRFHYDWRRVIDRSADEFVLFVRDIRSRRPLASLKVIAHSMGGLVTRRAMTEGRALTLAGDLPIDLLTVATPFGGIPVANWTLLVPVNICGLQDSHRCLRTAGSLVTKPGRLGPNVSHYKVDTREEGETRVFRGRLIKDVRVQLADQRNAEVDGDPRVVLSETIAAGHVGSLDHEGRVSEGLLKVLDRFAPPLP